MNSVDLANLVWDSFDKNNLPLFGDVQNLLKNKAKEAQVDEINEYFVIVNASRRLQNRLTEIKNTQEKLESDKNMARVLAKLIGSPILPG